MGKGAYTQEDIDDLKNEQTKILAMIRRSNEVAVALATVAAVAAGVGWLLGTWSWVDAVADYVWGGCFFIAVGFLLHGFWGHWRSRQIEKQIHEMRLALTRPD